MNYLSVAEFAEKNGVSDRYIRRLCAAGKLEARRSGRAYRIPETAELPADHRHLRGKVVRSIWRPCLRPSTSERQNSGSAAP